MITEDFWVYVSEIFRDQGRPGTGRRPWARDPPLAMITEDFWVYVGRLTEAAAREMFRLGHRPVL
ncbi:MAG: hypothetical protein QOJ73_3139 [Streptosporangiaceae bacterium]|jgi:hypothetical protein|nr:hypothetical protein [Streptosporangiaceae bacterium]